MRLIRLINYKTCNDMFSSLDRPLYYLTVNTLEGLALEGKTTCALVTDKRGVVVATRVIALFF